MTVTPPHPMTGSRSPTTHPPNSRRVWPPWNNASRASSSAFSMTRPVSTVGVEMQMEPARIIEPERTPIRRLTSSQQPPGRTGSGTTWPSGTAGPIRRSGIVGIVDRVGRRDRIVVGRDDRERVLAHRAAQLVDREHPRQLGRLRVGPAGRLPGDARWPDPATTRHARTPRHTPATPPQRRAMSATCWAWPMLIPVFQHRYRSIVKIPSLPHFSGCSNNSAVTAASRACCALRNPAISFNSTSRSSTVLTSSA